MHALLSYIYSLPKRMAFHRNSARAKEMLLIVKGAITLITCFISWTSKP